MNLEKPKRHQDRELLDKAHKGRCVICRRLGSDPCHVKSRGAGGGDYAWNVFYACRIHHTEQHSAGIVTFARKYLQFRNWLLANGWEFCEVRSKWIHN